MEHPNPTIQRRRRSERYKEGYDPAPAVQPLPQAPAPEQSPAASPVPAYLRRAPRPEQAPPQDDQRPALPPCAPSPTEAPPPRQTPAPPPPLDGAAPQPMSRARRRGELRAAEKPAFRLPWWILAVIVGLMMTILALAAAQNLMAAYLTQREEERSAAYQQVVDGHPIYFTDLIERYAQEYNLRPAFMSAIILNESSFRTDAESSVGARGLMQLMPDTAQWIADKLNVDNYAFERMFDAESNIRFGAWYLNYLSGLFRGDPVAVACAYHAGQSTVASWLSDRSISPDGVTLPLENLPDGPTKTYAGRVTRDYGIYDALYFQVFNPPAPLDGDADRGHAAMADTLARR